MKHRAQGCAQVGTWVCCFLVWLPVAGAQQTSGRGDTNCGGTAEQSLSEKLLVQSYLLSRQFVPDERVFFLAHATRTAAAAEPGLARLWSEELFQFTFELPPSWNRTAGQKNALVSLSYFDPERAMELLDSVDRPSSSDALPEDLRADAAETIFAQLWRQKGPASLSEIRTKAQMIGESGEYPYEALQSILLDLQRKDQAVAQTLFAEALSYYKRGSRVRSADRDFVEFLLAVHSVAPRAAVREAIEAVLKNSSKPATDEKQIYRIRLHTDKGVADLTSRADEMAFRLLPLIRDIDSDWASDLLRDRPALAEVAERAGGIQFEEGSLLLGPAAEGDPTVLQKYGMEQSRVAGIKRIAMQNPSEALRMTSELTDPAARVVALGQVTAGFASSDPVQATKLLEQTRESLAAVKGDDAGKVSALTSLAEASASLGNLGLFRSTLKEVFALGQEVFQQDTDTHPNKSASFASGFNDLSRATVIGVRVDSENTLGEVLAVQDPRLRAYLLIAAVQGLHDRHH